MEILMSVMIGIIFTVSIYLFLSRSLLRVIFGSLLLSHELQRGASPLLNLDAQNLTDPLPQALVLTAIVISFGVTSLLLVLAYRTYKVYKTDDLEQLRGSADE